MAEVQVPFRSLQLPSRSVVLCVTALLSTPLTFSHVHSMLQARVVGAAHDAQGGLLRRARRWRRGRYVLFSATSGLSCPVRVHDFFAHIFPPASPCARVSRAALPGAVNVDKTGSMEGSTLAALQVRAVPLPYPAVWPPRRVCILCCSPHHRLTRALLLQSCVPGAARVA